MEQFYLPTLSTEQIRISITYINDEIKSLANENFFHNDYDATLADVYGTAVDKENLVVEEGIVD